MRFIHMSDTHIGPTRDFSLHGVDPLGTLNMVVQMINDLPFTADFVLHTGDISNDRTIESYQLTREAFDRLHLPVYVVPGNHDDGARMQQYLRLPETVVDVASGRYDQHFVLSDTEYLLLDTRGRIDPGGLLEPEQLMLIGDVCKPEGRPLVIAMHHQPILTEVPWHDEDWDEREYMRLKNHEVFRELIAPARARIRGVFFGHIHRGTTTVQDGIFYSSAASSLLQFASYPGMGKGTGAETTEDAAFNVVTVNDEKTLVRTYTFAAVKSKP